MNDEQDNRLALFHDWIDDPAAMTDVADQVELLEAVLSCPYGLPAEYGAKMRLAPVATYHDAALGVSML